MRTPRRMLPLVAVAALVITLVVPVSVSSDPDFDAFLMTSAGQPGTTDSLPLMLPIWAIVLVAAATVWIPRWPALWAVVAFVAALTLVILPATLVLDPPRLMWDGWDEANNRPTGGMVVGRPFIGSALWVAGSLALTASGVLGILDAVRSRARRPAQTR
ncbi:MAG: hypothetical protein ACTMII_05275 [Brachybacterium sp.]|uniref:hypothetical protein n=1 Tax=unclassified Brachybacterium TaxID=2623841 RepID=UPI003F91204B